MPGVLDLRSGRHLRAFSGIAYGESVGLFVVDETDKRDQDTPMLDNYEGVKVRTILEIVSMFAVTNLGGQPIRPSRPSSGGR